MVRVRKRQIAFRDGDPISVPQVIGSSRMSYEKFITAMSDGGRVAATDVLANFARLERALTQALAAGNRVETPIGIFSISLGVGTRDDAGGFDVRGENARINFRAARSLLDAVRKQIEFDVENEISVRRPIPERVENSVSGVMLRSVHPADLVYVIGHNLDTDHENEEEGVFFTNAKGKETRATSYGRGNSAQLSVVVPNLPAGIYTMQVRAHRDEEGLQVGQLPSEIEVVLPGSGDSGE